MTRYVYVVAASKQEAETMAEYGWQTKVDADAHLKYCRQPPTDPFYGNKLHIYKVAAKGELILAWNHGTN